MSSKAASKSINILSPILGIVFLVIRTLTVSIHKSPYDMIHKLDQNGIIPPVWMLNLCFCILFFALGYAAGLIIICASSSGGRSDTVLAYKGGLYFLVSFFALTAHYSLFFALERLLMSLIVIFISVVSSVICAISWSRISSASTLIMVVCALFSSYIALINLLVMIVN